MAKKLISLIITLSFALALPRSTFSIEHIVTIINPLRGPDTHDASFSPTSSSVDLSAYYSNLHISSTFLIRPDAFSDANLPLPNAKTELGIFLEVTKTWAEKALVTYDNSTPWYYPKVAFLGGYIPADREKLLDTAFEEFKNKYSYYPTTVGAWYIDAYSANYLNKKYGVHVFLICSDQFGTDHYQIWGAPWGVPYSPWKYNLLFPINDKPEGLNSMILLWAARDPVYGYGRDASSSIYSIQPNDYLQVNKNTDYFNYLAKLYLYPKVGKFGQLTVGIENDYDKKYYIEHKKQIASLLTDSNLTFETATNTYNKIHNLLGSTHQIGDTKNYFQMDTKSRSGYIEGKLVDSRNYLQKIIDPHFANKITTDSLFWSIPTTLDTISEIDYNPKILIPMQTSNIFICILTIIVFFVVFKFMTKSSWKKLLLYLFFSLVAAIPMLRSGITYDYGVGFWGPNGHDAIWHISVINQIFNSFPTQNPVFAFNSLGNYHIGYNIFVKLLSLLTTISVFDLIFRILPVLFTFTTLYFSEYLYKIMFGKKPTFLLPVLLVTTGSLGWIVTLLREHTLGGESLFWSMQSVSTQLNPPFAFSLALLTFTLFLHHKNKQSSEKTNIIIGILYGLIAGIKIYSGLLVGASNLLLLFINKQDKSEQKKLLQITITQIVVSIFVLMFMGSIPSSNALLEFKPLWFTTSLVESIDKLYLPHLASLRQNLYSLHPSLKSIFIPVLELVLISIFILGNFGTRVIGFLEFIHKKSTSSQYQIKAIIIIGIIFPLLFVQKGTAWNTIQFLYYSLFFTTFFTVYTLEKYINSNLRLPVFIFFILISSVTSYSTLKDYFGNPPPAALPTEELYILNILKSLPSGTVLTYPYDKYLKDKTNINTPIPLYLYESTGYVSAFSQHQTFLEDEVNLSILNAPYQIRKNDLETNFFQNKSKFAARGFLLANKIDYIYLTNNQLLPNSPQDLQLRLINSQGSTRLYKVLK